MPTCWKFTLKSSRKPHLSVDPEGTRGTGSSTLCGLSTRSITGSARTVSKLDGDECPRCAAKMEAAIVAPPAKTPHRRTTAVRPGLAG